MAVERRNITLGTAGHIDHGKTALVKLLTGCDTDRLKIEKERGMSIELGFAPCLISDIEVGIVDVPGHEDFIKTMVAGATGIDACILVVAADDGIMPQTREHMEILTLLGVNRGLVALTKIDIVAPERVQLVSQQLRDYLKGTFLQDSPIVPISNVTGQGFETLYEALKALVASVQPRCTSGVFRLPVERAFSVKGYGTVVTGIPVAGRARVLDELVLLPQGIKGRVRAIQVYGREGQEAVAGQCAALNVPQWDHRTIERGDVVTVEDYFTPSQWYLCRLRLLDRQRLELRNASRVKFHTGTSERLATLYLFEQDICRPGMEVMAQAFLAGPILAGPCDRFIIRSLTPPTTIGGGQIIEALDHRLKRTNMAVISDIYRRASAVQEPKTFVQYILEQAGPAGAELRQICVRTKHRPEELSVILEALVQEGLALKVSARRYVHPNAVKDLRESLLKMVGDYHKAYPRDVGMPIDQLASGSGASKEVFDLVFGQMIGDGQLIIDGGLASLPGHTQQLADRHKAILDAVEDLIRRHLFDPPGPAQMAAELGLDIKQVHWALAILSKQQKVFYVAQDLWFYRDAIEQAKARVLAYIHEHGRLESVRFKYILGTTRKYAIPLLDYLDKIGFTRREGYTRYLR